ncbi:Glutathione S-transferase [Mycena indigotica]|uniref:glutathione transferase n=1 Tax=Mycena indigotica TaxID=2126181 RepID=A0A8H6S0V3_9AGAR|nr:Glutathione S-transferase [Mycena indigotica]KAF7290854.1 Glutathione S-transferase [Mycena indigotica]
MVLKLYAANRVGGGGALVAIVLAAKGIAFEFVPTEVSAVGPKSPELLRMQPFGQVPVIDDDGFILYESRAICRYIENKYPGQGPKFVPDAGDARGLAIFDQAMSVEMCHFYPAVLAVVEEVVFKPHYGQNTDATALAAAVKLFEAKLDVYEVILSKQKYTAGDSLSLVDIFHLTHAPLLARYANIHVLTDNKRPHVAEWWKNLILLPEWVELEAQGGIVSRKNI